MDKNNDNSKTKKHVHYQFIDATINNWLERVWRLNELVSNVLILKPKNPEHQKDIRDFVSYVRWKP